jgi:hypothetical protein
MTVPGDVARRSWCRAVRSRKAGFDPPKVLAQVHQKSAVRELWLGLERRISSDRVRASKRPLTGRTRLENGP